MFEQLEARQLLSAVLENGTLTINGTDGADAIHVYPLFEPLGSETIGSGDGDQLIIVESYVAVDVNGSVDKFRDRDVLRIIINGLGGDDTINSAKAMFVTINLSDPSKTITGFPQFIYGGDGNDTITGSGGNDSIDGGSGNDRIHGGAGNDEITGGDGADTLLGEAGDDTLRGGAGDDFLDGGDGDNQLNGEADQSPSAVLEDGILTINGTDEADTITVDETFITTDGTSTGPGGVAYNWAKFERVVKATINGVEQRFPFGSVQRIVINGLGGDDTIKSGLGMRIAYNGAIGGLPQFIDGGDGNDTITGGGGNDSIDGGNGDDVIYGGEGNDWLNGGAGNNKLYGEGGNDTLKAGEGADIFSGGAGVDTADYSDRVRRVRLSIDGVANDGHEAQYPIEVPYVSAPVPTVPAEQDNILTDVENLVGGRESDYLVGSDANNRLSGGPGNDNLVGGGGADVLSGGEGYDVADYSDHAQGVVVTLDGRRNDGSRRERDWVKADVESVTGSKYDDVLIGNSGRNFLLGGDGNDRLYGGAGNDVLKGGLGDDWMDGGAGDDHFAQEHTSSDKDIMIGRSGDDHAWSEQRDLLKGIEEINGKRR